MTACLPRIDAGGLEKRTQLLVARDERLFSRLARELAGSSADGPPEVTWELLRQGLRSQTPGKAYLAAFIAGRCTVADPVADLSLTQELLGLLADPSTPADVRIEVAMSLALRGERATATEALREAAASRDLFADAYKAAYYLAQLGDPSGFPALLRALRGELSHYRLMALRHLAAFLPYEGHEVDGFRIDITGLLSERLADPEELVRREVPVHLEEIGAPNLRELLEPVVRNDPAASVKEAARAVLERAR